MSLALSIPWLTHQPNVVQAMLRVHQVQAEVDRASFMGIMKAMETTDNFIFLNEKDVVTFWTNGTFFDAWPTLRKLLCMT